jgi:hypothetical protein
MHAEYDSDDPEELVLAGEEAREADREPNEEGVDSHEEDDDDDEEEDNEYDEDGNIDDDDDEEEAEEEDVGDDDEDDDEWEPMSVQEIVAELEESARSDQDLTISWEGSNMVGSMVHFTEEEMDELLEAISRSVGSGDNSWDRLIKCIAVDVNDPHHDWNLARRITTMLDRLSLTSLEWFAIEERPSFLEVPDEQPWKPHVVDHYLEWMTTTASIPQPERLSHLFLESLGAHPEVWSPFVAQFSSVQELYLTLREEGEGWRDNPHAARHARALASSLRARSRLRSLTLRVLATGLSDILSRLLRGLVSVPTLTKFNFSVHVDGAGRPESGPYGSEVAIVDVYKLVALTPSLTDVTIHVDESFAVLHGLLEKHNVTLERITFCEHVQDSDTKAKIEWLLTLNRYNRRCLLGTAPDPVEEIAAPSVPGGGHAPPPRPAGLRSPMPAAAWPRVLGRISSDHRADVMYHFLGKMPKPLLLGLSPVGRGLKGASPASDVAPED